MTLIKKIHWYSAAAANTVSESEDDRENGAWNKKDPIQRWGQEKPTQNLRELFVSCVCILIIQNCRIIKFRDTCDVLNLQNYYYMLVFVLRWFGSVGLSVWYLTQFSTKITGHQTSLNPRFLLILTFACIQHLESRTSVMSVFIYLEHQSILTSTLGYYLESE